MIEIKSLCRLEKKLGYNMIQICVAQLDEIKVNMQSKDRANTSSSIDQLAKPIAQNESIVNDGGLHVTTTPTPL